MIRNSRLDPRICPGDFKTKLVVLTGATSGIGYLTARKYASHGADLLCINRNLKKSEVLKHEIESEFGVRCDYKIADLSNLQDIDRVAGELSRLERPIDVLIHNAGIYLTKRELNAEGFDRVFVVHHLSSFMINTLLSRKFFNLTTEEDTAPPALDKEAAYELWTKSVEMTGVRDITRNF